MDSTIDKPPPFQAPAVDATTLDAVLDAGGPDLRAALCSQLIADFTRLRTAVGVADPVAAARAAHELKGLALTIGAARLAELAQHLEGVGPDITAAALAGRSAPVAKQIDAVLAVLRAAQQRHGRP